MGGSSFMSAMASSPIFRNVLAVASGTVSGQVVVFAFSPLITRIYGPEIFGLQGVFLALISILSPIVALRYPLAIVVAKNDGEAQQLSRLSLLIAFGISCVLGLVLLVGQSQQILGLLGAESIGSMIWFLPLALFCVALQDVANFSAARLSAFRVVGIVTVTQAFIVNLARVLGGLVAPVAGVLVMVTSLAPGLQAAMLNYGTRTRRQPAQPLLPTDTAALLKEHRDFPLYRMPTDVLNAASQSVPVILLAALYSPAAAGLYTLTRSVLNLPSNIIGTAVGNVLYARFAELSRENKALMPLLLRSTAALFALVPVIIGLAWFAPAVFAFVFGEQWREAGHYARWMSLWLSIAIANIPAVRLVPVIKAQGSLLVASILSLAARVLAMYAVFWVDGDANLAVAVFSLVSVIANAGLILMIMAATYRYEKAPKAQTD